MKPMLAKPFQAKWVKPNGYIQPKLDGVRMIWTGEEAMSRRGKPIGGVPELVKQLETFFAGVPLDGELYAHGKEFQKLVGRIRRSKNIDEDFDIGFHVYDMPLDDMPFEERFEALRSTVEAGQAAGADRVHLVETRNVIGEASEEDLNIYEIEGYEGTMWRSAEGLYKFGKRSADLLKIKTFMEEEFVIVGVEEKYSYEKLIVEAGLPGAYQYSDGTWYKDGEGTPQNTCGAIVVQIAEGVTSKVGTGMDDATRQAHWDEPPIGKKLTVKFQGFHEDGTLRFPVYKTLRDYE